MNNVWKPLVANAHAQVERIQSHTGTCACWSVTWVSDWLTNRLKSLSCYCQLKKENNDLLITDIAGVLCPVYTGERQQRLSAKSHLLPSGSSSMMMKICKDNLNFQSKQSNLFLFIPPLFILNWGWPSSSNHYNRGFQLNYRQILCWYQLIN